MNKTVYIGFGSNLKGSKHCIKDQISSALEVISASSKIEITFSQLVISTGVTTDYSWLENQLDLWVEQHTYPDMIILGGASGVDFLAERWADNNNIPLAVYNEAWSKPRPDFVKDSGRPEAVSSLAKEMLNNATHMLAFPGPDSVWTKKMMEMGVQMNVPIACVELPTSGL